MVIKKRKISVQSAKAKGRRLQNWVADKCTELSGIPNGHEDAALIESRPMGQNGNDIVFRGEARDVFPLSIECGAKETWDVHKKIKQARSNQDDGTDWLVFFKRSREKPVVIMDAEYYFRLLGRLKNGTK